MNESHKNLKLKKLNILIGPNGSGKSVYLNAISKEISTGIVYHFNDIKNIIINKDNTTSLNGFILYSKGQNIEAVLNKIKNSNDYLYKCIINNIKLNIPYIEDIYINVGIMEKHYNPTITYKERNTGNILKLHQLSDGSLRLICILVALLQPNPPETIIIDEPELGLHHTAISNIATIMKEVSNETNILVATNSLTLIDHFNAFCIILMGKDGPNNLNVETIIPWLQDYTVGELCKKGVINITTPCTYTNTVYAR